MGNVKLFHKVKHGSARRRDKVGHVSLKLKRFRKPRAGSVILRHKDRAGKFRVAMTGFAIRTLYSRGFPGGNWRCLVVQWMCMGMRINVFC